VKNLENKKAKSLVISLILLKVEILSQEFIFIFNKYVHHFFKSKKNATNPADRFISQNDA
jgi:hypothetical protein